jgi:hypothetical protein
MTLAMTVAAPWGIWQCSDCRLSDTSTYPPIITDDWSLKHVSVITNDGFALVSYTGVGAFRHEGQRKSMSEWITEKLTGEIRTLSQIVEWIRQEASVLFSELGRLPHEFSIGAFRGGVPWFVQVTNIVGFEPSGKPQTGCNFLVNELRVDQPIAWFVGSGKRAVSEDDRRLLSIKIGVQPERPEELIELLAEINRRASEHLIYGGSVSAACHTCWVPPTGGIKGQFFSWEKESPPAAFVTPVILYGIYIDKRELVLSLLRQGKSDGFPPSDGPVPGV